MSALLRRSNRCCTWEEDDDDDDDDDGGGSKVCAGWLLSLGLPFAPSSRADAGGPLLFSPSEARAACAAAHSAVIEPERVGTMEAARLGTGRGRDRGLRLLGDAKGRSGVRASD